MLLWRAPYRDNPDGGPRASRRRQALFSKLQRLGCVCVGGRSLVLCSSLSPSLPVGPPWLTVVLLPRFLCSPLLLSGCRACYSESPCVFAFFLVWVRSSVSSTSYRSILL